MKLIVTSLDHISDKCHVQGQVQALYFWMGGDICFLGSRDRDIANVISFCENRILESGWLKSIF